MLRSSVHAVPLHSPPGLASQGMALQKHHINELKSMSAPDETLVRLLKVFCLLKGTTQDPWDFLVAALRRSSFKAELLVLDPQRADQNTVAT